MLFTHEGMPAEVQVGVMAHAWETDGPGDQTRTRADIDYVRFAVDAPQTSKSVLLRLVDRGGR